MKATVKRSNGDVIEVEGTREECVAAIQATLGIVAVTTPLFPYILNPVYTPPVYTPPNIVPLPYIPWGGGNGDSICPWPPGTTIITCGTSSDPKASDQPAYRVSADGKGLQALTQGQVLEAMGITFDLALFSGQGNNGAAGLPGGTMVPIYGNDFDKGSYTVKVGGDFSAIGAQG